MSTQRMCLGRPTMTDEEAREVLVDYTQGAGDREIILELYNAGKIDDCVVTLDKPLYRGLVITKKRVDKEKLECKGYGSFSEDYGVAWEFAKTLVEDDVANIILEVGEEDVDVVINMEKAFSKYGVTDDGCLFSMKYEKERFVIYNSAKMKLI